MEAIVSLKGLVTRRNAVRLILLYSSLGFVQVALRLLKCVFRVRRMWRTLSPLPLGRYNHSPLWGQLPELIRNFDRLHDLRMEATGDLPVSKFHGACFDPDGIGITVNDPRCVKHFLKDGFDKYTKPADEEDIFFTFLREWLGDGIFTIQHGSLTQDQGRSWTLQRKIAANIFTRGNFNNLMQEVFQAKSERLCAELVKFADQGTPVDMQCQVFNFTMDSIMRIFFGEESDTLGGAPHKYGLAYDEAHHTMFDYVFRSLGPLSLFKYLLPWPFGGAKGLAWRAHGALSPICRRFRAAVRVLDQESERLIRACRADPQLPSRRDLLALFVQAEEKQQFSTKFLRDVVLNFVIAGRDTTACLLSWMLYALALNPEVQTRLQHEIDAKAPEGTNLNFKSLAHTEMPYLQGVLYETLRIWPPVPFDAKVALDNDVFPGGIQIPKGCKVIFLPYAMGRDPEVWPEPLAFRPERWIPFSAPTPHEFPVFQAGPRICLGMDMAIFEAKVVMCNLLRHYTFQLLPGEQEKITYTKKLTMSISNSKGQQEESEHLWMLVQRRASG